MSHRILVFLFVLIGFEINNFSKAQNVKNNVEPSSKKTLYFNYKALIIPIIFIGYGFIGLNNYEIKKLDHALQEKIYGNRNNKLRIDDYLLYVPSLAVYGLNVVGLQGKTPFKERTLILTASLFIMGSTVSALKQITRVERPDGSARTSFPSGHTAAAFMGAEFLFQEYKKVSLLYGIAGYVIASGVGFLRIYNNRHWFSDVVAGAGIGILSTKIAYWISPWLKEKIFTKKEKITSLITPYYNGQSIALGMSLYF